MQTSQTLRSQRVGVQLRSAPSASEYPPHLAGAAGSARTRLSSCLASQALLAAHKAATGDLLRVDAYGSGEDADDIRAAAADAVLDFAMHGGVDHLDACLRPYRCAPSRAAL